MHAGKCRKLSTKAEGTVNGDELKCVLVDDNNNYLFTKPKGKTTNVHNEHRVD